MDLQRPKAKPVADAICAAVGMAVGPEETLVSGYRLWQPKKNIDKQSMHISKRKGPKSRS